MTITDHMIHDLVITSLKPHSDLKGLHTFLLAKSSDKPQEITLSYIENQVKLHRPVDGKQETNDSVEEPIASLTTAYFTQKKDKWPSRGKFTSVQSRSPIKKSKDNEPLRRLPTSVWDKMSKEARDEYLQIQRTRQGNQASKRGNRGRGGHRSQRPTNKTDSEHEADMAELT